MAWTELHDTLPDHPKTMLLAAEMNCTKPHAIGLLCSLWCYTMRYGNSGTLSPTYWKAFAVSMGMDDPDGVLAALRSSGWVEPNGDNVTCHDWDDYAGRLEDYKAANRERQRKYRERAREKLLDNANVTRDVTPKKRESHTTVPNSTQHNTTEPTTLSSAKPPSEVTYPDDFQDFWQHYPKRKGKGAALKAWKKLSTADKSAAIDRAEWVAGCWDANDPDEQRRQFIQDPATWLNARGWEDEDSAVELMARGR